MGNCQAADAATVVIQHPGGNKVERIYWSVSAQEVMASNPGHYVALVVTSAAARSENGTPVRQLKLLRPDDTLLIGQVYRLISFEDVLKEFAAKKSVKLGKLLESRGLDLEKKKKKKKKPSETPKGLNPNPNPNPNPESCSSVTMDPQVYHLGNSSGSSSRGLGRYHGSGGQWKPALQSIAEVGT